MSFINMFWVKMKMLFHSKKAKAFWSAKFNFNATDDKHKRKINTQFNLENLHYKIYFFHKGIYVQNLNQFIVTDLKNTMKYLAKGNQSR